jgi:hypothetical protein
VTTTDTAGLTAAQVASLPRCAVTGCQGRFDAATAGDTDAGGVATGWRWPPGADDDPGTDPVHEHRLANRLSLAASAIWRRRTAAPDPYDQLGYDNDCGPAIDAYHRAGDLAAVAAAGYATPGEYNADLAGRMVTAGGRVTLRVRELLMVLEIPDVCPRCGAGLVVTAHRTMQYGGGWDTTEKCTVCGYADVYV